MKRAPTGHRIGQHHQNAKLSDEDVKKMRERYLAYVVGYGTLAKEFGCGESTVRDIVTYATRYDT